MDSEDRRCAFTSWFLYSLSAYPWEEYFISLCSLSLNVLWRLWQNEGRWGCLKDWLWVDMCVVLATVPWVVWVLFLACMLSCSVVSDSLWPHGLLAHQAPLSMGFSRQEYWSGLPFPSPGDLPDPEINPTSPALAGGFFTRGTWEAPLFVVYHLNIHPLANTV